MNRIERLYGWRSSVVGIDGDEAEKTWRFILLCSIFVWRNEASAGHRERQCLEGVWCYFAAVAVDGVWICFDIGDAAVTSMLRRKFPLHTHFILPRPSGVYVVLAVAVDADLAAEQGISKPGWTLFSASLTR